MKLFERSGGHWLFWSGFLYLSLTVLVGFSPYRDYTMLVQSVWLIMIALPLLCNPLARWLNMKETNMFDFFRRKTAKEYMDEASNVYNLPKPKLVDPTPPKPEPKEEPAKIFYRLGLTDNNRVSFQMGYSEITMNKAGCQQMIEQLEFFQSQLYDDGPSGGPDGDGGEPVPVPEQKAA